MDEIESKLVGYVKEIVAPLLILFDFFELDDTDYERLVDQFVSGKAT